MSVIPLFTNNKDEYIDLNVFFWGGELNFTEIQDSAGCSLIITFLFMSYVDLVWPSFCLEIEGFLQLSVVNFACKLTTVSVVLF